MALAQEMDQEEGMDQSQEPSPRPESDEFRQKQKPSYFDKHKSSEKMIEKVKKTINYCKIMI